MEPIEPTFSPSPTPKLWDFTLAETPEQLQIIKEAIAYLGVPENIQSDRPFANKLYHRLIDTAIETSGEGKELNELKYVITEIYEEAMEANPQTRSTPSRVSESPLHLMPDEAVIKFMIRLPVKDLLKTGEVSTRFRDLRKEALVRKINAEGISFKELNLDTPEEIEAFLNFLGKENCERLRFVDLSKTRIDSRVLDLLCQRCPHITNLNLSSCVKISLDGFYPIKGLSELEHLILRQTAISDEELLNLVVPEEELSRLTVSEREKANLTYLPRLKSLTLAHCPNITDAGLESVGKFKKSLLHLNLEGCVNIKGPGVHHLGNLINLEFLSLNLLRDIPDENLAFLFDLTKLRALGLSRVVNLGETGIKAISRLEKLEQLSLENCNNLTDDDLKYLSGLVGLKELYLSGCTKLTSDALKHLANLREIRGLYLDSCSKITDSGLQHLALLDKLEALALSHSEVTGSGLKFIQGAKNLKTLLCTKTSKEALGFIGHFTNLETLEMERALDLTEEDFANLAHLKKLKALKLKDCYGANQALKYLSEATDLERLEISHFAEGASLQDSDIPHLAKLTKLVILSLQINDVTNNGLLAFPELPRLESLELHWGDNITRDGFKRLASYRSLRTLVLSSFNQIKDEDLTSISGLDKLESLYLEGFMGLRNEGLKEIGKLTKLMHLQLKLLWHTNDEALGHLAPLTRLRILTLEICRYTGVGIGYLTALNDLQVLTLDSSELSNAGLEEIAKLKGLRLLKVKRDTKATREGIQNFLNKSPVRRVELLL